MHIAFLLLVLCLVACEMSPKQARRELVQMGYSYSRNSMAESIRKEDAVALELFLVGGMGPGTVSAGYSVLEQAAGSPALVAILLAAGADPNFSGGVSTPLIEAVSRGQVEVAQQLLAAGAAADGTDGTGRTPLMVTAEKGAADLVAALLAAGADPNARSQLGSTALGLAEQAGHEEIARLLIDAGGARGEGADLMALMEPSRLTATAPDRYRVHFATTAGDFVVEVERGLASHAADRFYNLVKHGFFDEQRFFRVVRGRLVQFGLHGTPEVAARWYEAMIPDDAVTGSNARGTLSFATGTGANSRTTQVFINLSDNADFDRMGFAPFGRVVEGMAAVEAINGEYGELPEQARILKEGEEHLGRNFPDLDRVAEARLVD